MLGALPQNQILLTIGLGLIMTNAMMLLFTSDYRILTTMAAELLAAATQRELSQLDEKLYLEVFAQPEASVPRRTAARR